MIYNSVEKLCSFLFLAFCRAACHWCWCLISKIKEDIEVEPQCITSLMEQLDVFISVKPKPKQPSKVCTLTQTYIQHYIHYVGRHPNILVLSHFAITFIQTVSRWFLEDEWSQFSSVEEPVVHHINNQHDPLMFDNQNMSKYLILATYSL